MMTRQKLEKKIVTKSEQINVSKKSQQNEVSDRGCRVGARAANIFGVRARRSLFLVARAGGFDPLTRTTSLLLTVL